jgi:hypothetical protein
MDIPGKLRADLKRIYGANDPLNYIEDVTVAPCEGEEILLVQLRVPDRFRKYIPGVGDRMDALVYRTRLLGEWNIPGVSAPIPQKPAKKKIDPMDAINWFPPKRIIYSGLKTIVIWPDGSKTMVSLMEGKEHDEYGAFCAAVVKKMFGATHKAKKFLESVAVRPEPKPKKAKEHTEEVTCNG